MAERKKKPSPTQSEASSSDLNSLVPSSDEARKILSGWGSDLRIALLFLTRLPLPASFGSEIKKGAIAPAMRAFPLIGAALGIFGGLIMGLSEMLGWTPLVGALLAILAIALLTGALHEDGLADVADGFGAGTNKQTRLDIMKDTKIGSFGVVALIFSIALHVAILAGFDDVGAASAALIASASVSRAAMALIAHRLKPSRKSGLAVTAGSPDDASLYAALALGGALTLLFLGPVGGIIALIVATATCFGVIELSRRLIGGYTGDVLGAAQQICEIAVLLAALAVL